MMPQEKGSVRSLGKALELLELLNRSRVPMTLQALSQASGYPKTPSTRCWPPLRSYGCIRQESDGRYYLWGQRKLFEVGLRRVRCMGDHPLRPSPFGQLAQQTQYTALLSCVEGSNIVVIDQRVNGTGIQVASRSAAVRPFTPRRRGNCCCPSCRMPRCAI